MIPRPDPLEAVLREAPYVDDGAFTDRVLAALPPRRRSPRAAILGISGVLAAVVGAVALGDAAAGAAASLATAGTGVLLVAGAGAVLLAALVARVR